MPLLPPTYRSLQFRTFSTTTACLAKSTKQRLTHEHSSVPTYPYGPSQIYKQSNFGLYGSQKIRFGNSVSEKNEIKNRRYWRPNVQRKRLWSAALGQYLKVRVTARVLRTIDKCGGLDEYLLGEKSQRIKDLGMGGWKLRWRIMQTESVKERFRLQREGLGLPPKEDVLLGIDGNLVSKERIEEEIRSYDRELAKQSELDIGEDLDGRAEEPNFMEEQPSKNKVLP
ncbi:hypothetical protein F5884DRAFT_782539 [Xylogone sp. PMI_703]|nr:hypothetical protein F5884DRAFT_782539 [Xylogone sp. PMI_703]